MNNTVKLDKNIIKSITKGIAISVIINIVLLFLYSIILVKTKVSENSIQVVITTITAFSILLGSTIGNFKTRKYATLKGLAIGIVHMSILYVIAAFLCGGCLCGYRIIIVFMAGVLMGGIGGIIGANFKRKILL